LTVHHNEGWLKLNKIVDSLQGVNKAALFGCGKLGRVNMEKGMPNSNPESLFWLNDSHSAATIWWFSVVVIEIDWNSKKSSILREGANKTIKLMQENGHHLIKRDFLRFWPGIPFSALIRPSLPQPKRAASSLIPSLKISNFGRVSQHVAVPIPWAIWIAFLFHATMFVGWMDAHLVAMIDSCTKWWNDLISQIKLL
jgi:hypothetical protein